VGLPAILMLYAQEFLVRGCPRFFLKQLLLKILDIFIHL
jgi:hypothetical protein